MRFSVIAYVSEMDRSVAFYESLGFERLGAPSPMWTAFRFGDAMFALHRVMDQELPPASDRLLINLGVNAAELERLHARCEEMGYTTGGPITDVGFGPHFLVKDPDGLPVQFTTPTR